MFKRFLRDRRGNVAMMFGLAAVPLLAATGAAIDFSRAYEERMVVQDAMDSAALAAARLIGIADEADVIAEAEAFFRTQTAGRLSHDVEIFVEIDGTSVIVTSTLAVPTSLLNIVGVNDINFNLLSRTEAGGRNVEVAMVLDITGSMCTPNCNALNGLKDAATSLVNLVIQDEQEPFYSKVALVPYSIGVNVGSYATTARGSYTSPVTVTNVAIAYVSGSTKTISSISRQNPARVTTSAAHGYATGDVITITGLKDNGNNSFADNLNGNQYTITNISNTVFSLNGVNSTNYRSFTTNGGSTNGSSTQTKECLNACNLVVTESASGTPYATGTRVFLDIGGDLGDQLLETDYIVGATTSTTFVLTNTIGTNYDGYDSGGRACQAVGCEYFRFIDADGNPRVHRITTCVSERVVTDEEYTDSPPGDALVGRVYPASSSNCPASQIVPLTTDDTLLNQRIAALTAAGSTAGHIGIAWGWYTLAPDWDEVWPSGSDPAAYDAPETLKVAVIMTDGAFNTAYCEGVVSEDTANGVVSDSARNSCDATNGDPFTQAETLCEAMKEEDIIIYTVGFNVGDDEDVVDLMNECSSGASYTYLAASSAELSTAFEAIGNDIRRLRIAE